MKPTPAPGLLGTKPFDNVLAEVCRRDLVRLERMPYAADYISPIEILAIVRMATTYNVDWTAGLEPRGEPDELVESFLLTKPANEAHAEPVQTPRKVRMRSECMLEDFNGTLVPDGHILWAMEILGKLRNAIVERIQFHLREGA